MNALTETLDIPAFDPISYDAAVCAATIRAQHSFFDSHVIEDEFGCFLAIDEGEYNALPQALIDRIVYSVREDRHLGQFGKPLSLSALICKAHPG